MRRLLLDSSVYISSLNLQDSFHKKTTNFLTNLQKAENVEIAIVVPVLIILEVANVMKKTLDEMTEIFSGGEIVELTLETVAKVTPIFKKLSLKTADGIIVACAAIYNAEIISWDKKLIQEANKLVKAYTP